MFSIISLTFDALITCSSSMQFRGISLSITPYLGKIDFMELLYCFVIESKGFSSKNIIFSLTISIFYLKELT